MASRGVGRSGVPRLFSAGALSHSADRPRTGRPRRPWTGRRASEPTPPMTLLVVLPTYNERLNLEKVVEAVMRHDFTRMLVVDDASPDGTGALADQLAVRWPGRIDVMHSTGPRGLGLAYIDGLRHALATDAEAVGQMDADLSHDPM